MCFDRRGCYCKSTWRGKRRGQETGQLTQNRAPEKNDQKGAAQPPFRRVNIEILAEEEAQELPALQTSLWPAGGDRCQRAAGQLRAGPLRPIWGSWRWSRDVPSVAVVRGHHLLSSAVHLQGRDSGDVFGELRLLPHQWALSPLISLDLHTEAETVTATENYQSSAPLDPPPEQPGPSPPMF